MRGPVVLEQRARTAEMVALPQGVEGWGQGFGAGGGGRGRRGAERGWAAVDPVVHAVLHGVGGGGGGAAGGAEAGDGDGERERRRDGEGGGDGEAGAQVLRALRGGGAREDPGGARGRVVHHDGGVEDAVRGGHDVDGRVAPHVGGGAGVLVDGHPHGGCPAAAPRRRHPPLHRRPLPKQLARLNVVQQRTSTAEDEISNRLAVLQMLVADQQMARATTADPPPSESMKLGEVREAMEPKLAGLCEIFMEAEKLRLQTLQELFVVLSPLQAVQYTIAALEMVKAMHKLGEKLQESHHSSGDTSARSPAHSGLNIWDIASQGEVEQLQDALNMGLDPSESDYEGRTPLHLAAGKGQLECIALLVGRGAEVNRKDNDGASPLLHALKGGHDKAAIILRNYGARPDIKDAGNELCKAAASGDMGFVERLVKAGVDPNQSDYSQRTPLHILAADGTAQDVEFLVHKGADVLIKDRHGYTPVDEARDNDNEATLKVLEAEVARRQQELDADDDDNDAGSDDSGSSSPMDDDDDDDQDVDMMQLTDGDHCSTC